MAWIKFEQELYNSDQLTRIICANYTNGQYVIELHLDRYYQSRIVLKFDTEKKRNVAFNNIILALENGHRPIVNLEDVRGFINLEEV